MAVRINLPKYVVIFFTALDGSLIISAGIFILIGPPGSRGMSSPLPDGNNIMLIPIIPPPIERAFMVAHELRHLLRKSADNYFGIAGTDANSSENADYINSMVEDHRIDSILERYGFDLEADEPNLRNQMTIINSSNYFSGEIAALTGFTNFKLCCDLIGEHFTTWQELEAFLKSKFSDLVDGVNELYHFIKENENDIHTNERKIQLLGTIHNIAARHPTRSFLGAG